MSVPADPLSLASATRIDSLCDQFEADWRTGRPTPTEDLLAPLPPSERQAALKALLRVELELRQRTEVPPSRAEYSTRFPDHAAAVSAIFEELARQPTTDTSVNQAQTRTISVGHDQTKCLAADEPQPAEIGRFVVLGTLGEGAFGTVYRARDAELDREVAIKVPRAGTLTRPGDVERFLRESKVAATMQHPNICPVYEVGTANGRPFIVMALVPGKSLADHLKNRREPFPPRQAALIVRKLAQALELAHQKGIVHRDLKPANVLIDDDRKDVVVMDFGLARREEEGVAQLTHSGMLMGTPAYMSPEQALGDTAAIGPASDIYSLGVILYELLAGQRPFTGSMAEVLGKILHVDPPPPSALRADVDPGLEAIAMQAMAKNPADRYPSMRALADALGNWLKGPATNNVGDSLRESPSHDAMTQPAATSKPLAAEPKSVGRPARQRLWQLLTALALFAGLTAATIFFLQTPDGTVRIEINDPAIKVVVDRGIARIEGADKDHVIELKPGEHGLTITRGDFTFDTTKFELKKRGQTTLKIEFLAGNIQVTQDGRVLGSTPLPAAVAVESPDWPADAPPRATTPFDHALAKRHQQAWADYLGVPVEKEVKLPGGESLSLVLIPPGEFSMGTSAQEQARFLEVVQTRDKSSITRIAAEGPQHRVRITHPFYLGRCEVTQAQWQSVMGANPSEFREPLNHPVETVSWNDIQPFLAKLNAGASAELFALPTEAQWEYACRAGTGTPWQCGDNDADLRKWAWFYNAAHHGGPTYPVGQLKPNAFGLYDLHGNVWEWCADRYAADYYANSPTDNPRGPSLGFDRVLRGGSWFDRQWHCRSAYRIGHEPNWRNRRSGLRLTQSIDVAQHPPQATQSAALLFDGIDDYVEIADWKYDGSHPLTVEAWVTPEKLAKGVEIISTSEQSGFNLAIWKDDRWSFSAVIDSKGTWALAPFESGHSNRRVHIAGVYDRKQVRLYLDGKEMQRVPAPGVHTPSTQSLVFGGNPNGNKIVFHYAGQIDEVRLSRVGRYAGNFQPREQFEADADTMALYHFDEGMGDVLKDSSGNNRHGKIVGATWVRSDGKAIGPAIGESGGQDQGSLAADRAAVEYLDAIGAKYKRTEDRPDGTIVEISEAAGLTDEGLLKLQKLPELRLLNLTGSKITEQGLPHLAGFSALEELDLSASDAGLIQIARLSNLKRLGISFYSPVTDAGLVDVARLTNLKELNISYNNITSAGVLHLHPLKKLRVLCLNSTKVDDEGLAIVKDLPRLETLWLGGCPVTDAGLAHLEGHPSLQGLIVGNPNVTDATAARLPTLKKLSLLWLGGAELTDASVEHLAKIQTLYNLDLRGTQLTDEGLARLRAALPGCTIEPKSMPANADSDP